MSVWEPGDRALCVRTRVSGEPCDSPSGTLLIGRIYTVTRVTLPVKWDHGPVEVGLHLAETKHKDPRNAKHQFFAGLFKKIYPHTPDEQDEITIRLMKGEKVEMI